MNISDNVKNPKLLLFAIAIASFMSSLDSCIVNIALPTLSVAFDVSTGLVSWVVTIYLLVLTSSLMIFGKLSDRIGFRRIFLVGFLVFVLGSLFCALSPTFIMLVISRAIQAVGGAMLGAISMAMVSAFMPPKLRAKAFGFVVTVASLGVAAGPFFGGILTEMLSWHWIFLINIPVGIIACVLGAAVIPSMPTRENTGSFDKLGAIYLSLALAALIFGLNFGSSYGFTSIPILAAFALSFGGILLFIRQEGRAPDPLLDLSLYRGRAFLFANIGTLLVTLAYTGSEFLLPFFFEYVQGMSTMTAGLYLTVPSVTLMVGGMLSGSLYHRYGPRKICVVASAVYIMAFLLLATFGVGTSSLVIILALALLGFGIGFYYSANTSEIMSLAPREKQGMVSSLTNTERNAGATLGIVIFELVFIHSLITISDLGGLTEGVLVNQPELLSEVMSSAFDIAFFGGAIVAAIVLILSLFTPDPENLMGL